MKKRKKPRARLRVLEAIAAGPAPGVASVPPSELEQLSEEHKLLERQELIDRHRGQRSELVARQARETADLLGRHVDEDKALQRAQERELAQMWRRHGRAPSGWQMRVLGGIPS